MLLHRLRHPVANALVELLGCALLALWLLRSGSAAAQSRSLAMSVFPPETALTLPPALSLRPAFGSLCALAPLSCALIDRPFALAIRIDVLVYPKATAATATTTADATGILIPFSLSVPILGRAEVGLGSCYLGWFGGETNANAAQLPRGLCPFWLAAKGILFPWFRDAHRKPALAAEYQFEYSAGPFSGRNLLGFVGPLSRASVAYRHPVGPIELGLSAAVLLDHTTHVGSAELGAHFGYKLPVGEFLWTFAQAGARAPSWGPQDIAPKVAGFLAIGAQQRADFGAGAGFTLLISRSEADTSVSVLLRFLSFEFGPHIKPLFPPKPKPEPPPAIAVGVHTSAAAIRETELRRRILQGACYLRDARGHVLLQTGMLDPSGTYCDWDGLRLPLGSPISHFARGTQQPFVRGGPFEAGAVAGMDRAAQHWIDLYNVVREHGPAVLVPDKEQVKEWAEQWVAECGSQPVDCIKDKARRTARDTADRLRAWGQKPRDEQLEEAGELLGEAIISALPNLLPVPGAGKGAAALGERAAARAAERGAVKAAERAAAKTGQQAAKTVAREAGEEAAEHAVPVQLQAATRAAPSATSMQRMPSQGRANRQARLREIADDPNTSNADRGWIQQDINEISEGKRTRIRNPPGKELAHERGREAAKGYDYSHSNLQDADLHKTQHKYDDFGRKNKERPITPSSEKPR